MKVLIASDDDDMVVFISSLLENAGYIVGHARGEMDLFDVMLAAQPNLLILEWSPINETVPEICKRIRRSVSIATLPVIIISSRHQESDRVEGLESGADDFVITPFFAGEFVARIHAVLRRSERGSYSDTLKAAGITIDRVARRVSRNGRTIDLGPTEFRFLEILMQHKGPMTRSALAQAIWPPNELVDLRTIDVHIGRLRRALVRAGEDDPIQTIRGAGYQFVDNA